MAERETVRSQILSIARTLTGAEQDEEMLLQRICLAQEAQLARALREGVKQEDCEDAFICAAAWLAAAALMRPYTKDGGFYFCRTQG